MAHGNSLRAIVMELDGLTQEEVVGLEIGTCRPITYEIGPSGKVLQKNAGLAHAPCAQS